MSCGQTRGRSVSQHDLALVIRKSLEGLGTRELAVPYILLACQPSYEIFASE